MIQTLGNVARVKKSVQNLVFRAFFLTLATFPRVWVRPFKHGNHKVIGYPFLGYVQDMAATVLNPKDWWYACNIYNLLVSMMPFEEILHAS